MTHHHHDCPACVAADKLNITDQDEISVLHAMAAHFADFMRIQNLAQEIDFDLSDDVIDLVAECVGAAMEGAPQNSLN